MKRAYPLIFIVLLLLTAFGLVSLRPTNSETAASAPANPTAVADANRPIVGDGGIGPVSEHLVPPTATNTPTPSVTPSITPSPTATPRPSPTATPIASPTIAPSPTVLANIGNLPARPFSPAADEHWAEADLGKAQVTLYQGDVPQLVFEMSYGSGDAPNRTTYPGFFTVYAKTAELHESLVPGHFIRYWVGFDPKWANGFHSVVLDRRGQMLDDRTGLPISSGCIRTAMPHAAIIYDWLPMGAHVWVH